MQSLFAPFHEPQRASASKETGGVGDKSLPTLQRIYADVTLGASG